MIKYFLLFLISSSLYATNYWHKQIKVDPFTDAKIINFTNIAEKGIGTNNKSVTLVLRCNSKKDPEIFINWQSYLGLETIEVTSRFDKENVDSIHWTLSTNKKSSFYDIGEIATKSMINDFIKYNKFFAKVTPYNENPIEAIFNLKGFSKLIKPYKKICRVKSKDEILSDIKAEIQRVLNRK